MKKNDHLMANKNEEKHEEETAGLPQLLSPGAQRQLRLSNF
jgi:hypothetical protein